MKSLLFPLALAAILIAAAPATRAQQSYTVTDLGSLPAYSEYFGIAINATGQAAVNGNQGSLVGQALLYDGTTLVNLPVFGSLYHQAQASDINNLGWVVGWCDKGSGGDGALWKDGNIVDLGNGVNAYAINNASSPQITGSVGTRKGNHAFLWQNGSSKTLPFYSGDAINDNGEIVGRTGPYGGPCYWRAPNTLVNLPTLGGTGASRVLAINNAGLCVGYSSSPDGTTHSVLWQNGALVQDLGWHNGQGFEYGAAINNNGTVVGGQSLRWEATNGFVDLSTLVTLPSGWNFYALSGINDSGQITGTVIDASGHYHAVILTPQ